LKKKIILYLFISISVDFFAQNDPCSAVNLTSLFGPYIGGSCSGGGSSALTITPPAVNAWSLNGSGISGLVTTCAGTIGAGSQDYWYSFTAPTGMGPTQIDISSAGGGLANPEYQMYSSTGACPTVTLSYVSCGTSTGSFTPTAGTTYYIRIYGNATTVVAMGKFVICARTSPVNDLCTNAIPMVSGTTYCGNTIGASNNAASTSGSCSTDQYVWYKFTTGNPVGCYSFNGTNFNSTNPSCPSNAFLIYSGCSATGAGAVALNGSNISNNIYNDFSTADLTTALAPNTTYYVAVGSGDNATFCINYKANVSAAANDVCSGAQAIGTTSVLADNASAGCEYTYIAAQDNNIAPATICAGSLENVSWFYFTALSTGTVTITFSNILCNNGGGGFQTGLLTGACGASTIGVTGAAICAAAASGTVTYNITSAIAGQNYLIGMDGNAGSNCHFAVSGTNIIALPIELSMFNVQLNGNYADLLWTTLSEKHNDYFTIERSRDGVFFEPLKIVNGAGNSLDQKDYYFQDKNPLIGISYYRLKQTDFNGKESYSVIQSISIDEKNIFDFNLFPNPLDKNEDIRLRFAGSEDDLLHFLITDITGNILSEKDIKLNESLVEINLKHHFSSGIYFIKVVNNAGNEINQKFIVN